MNRPFRQERDDRIARSGPVRDERTGRSRADGGVRNLAAASRMAATRGLPTATPQSQISRDTKASARGAMIANSRDGAVATNGGMPSDFQVRREWERVKLEQKGGGALGKNGSERRRGREGGIF